MKIKDKQLSLSDIYDDVQSFFEEDKPKFIKLFESFIDLSELIPSSFYAYYYSISLLKSSIAVDSFKLINTRSIKADVFLSATLTILV